VCCFRYLEIHYTAYNYVRVKVGYVQRDTIMRIFPLPETTILHSSFHLTSHSIVLTATLIVAQLIKKSPTEHKAILLCSHQSAISLQAW
jgi:hypothetical protein